MCLSQNNFTSSMLPGAAALCILGSMACPGCTKDKASIESPATSSRTVTYGRHVRPMVLSKCALPVCHVSGFPFGDFTKYADLKVRVDNGKVNTLVIENKLMPPSGSAQLDETEMEQLKDWIKNGAPED